MNVVTYTSPETGQWNIHFVFDSTDLVVAEYTALDQVLLANISEEAEEAGHDTEEMIGGWLAAVAIHVKAVERGHRRSKGSEAESGSG